jgi:predicted Rossmann fold nucleotide-binding protein DprA/Smf involved in DNA uptake
MTEPPARRNRAKSQERDHMIRPHYITPPIEEGLPLFGAARSSDPVTSHAAAAQAGGLATKHQRQILAALLDGPAGASGIAARCGLLPHQVNKRINELARDGRIVQTGRVVTSSSGRGEREWQATAALRRGWAELKGGLRE